ncbi:MAG: ribonuclease E activity regulator RraA [Acidobacteriota bacterium]
MSEFATADLIDDFGDELQSCCLQFRSFGQRARFAGPASTVRCIEDNKLVRAQLEKRGEGRVLIIDGGSSLRTALVGDILAGLGLDNGWAGIVAVGAIRDSVAIDTLDFAVKALGTNPRKSGKLGIGAVDIEVYFGDVAVSPGDWIYSDEDGLVVAERPLLGETS